MDYVSNIANSIQSHANCVSVLGPEIYAAIAEWEKKEIPFSLVIESIDEVCRYKREAVSTVDSIDRLQAAVAKNFRDWLTNSPSAKTASV